MEHVVLIIKNIQKSVFLKGFVAKVGALQVLTETGGFSLHTASYY